ncbi:MAG: hypothetical protein ACO3A4_05720 [Silvanigrellaceae bacterium]
MRVDLLTLYAFSDKTHAKQRELWKGFLLLVMPVLLEAEGSEIERVLESAQCRSVESMISALEAPTNAGQLMWSISGTFAELLGLEPELGLSAFLDVTLPTRVHSIGGGLQGTRAEVVVTQWLRAFREVQQRPEFLEITTEWKRAFDVLMEEGDEEGEEFDETGGEEISPDTPEIGSSEEEIPTERRRSKRSRSA